MFDSWGMRSLAGLLISACALVSQSTPRPSAEQMRVALGQMPPSFDQDVARVVADLDRMEEDTLQQLDRTTLDRERQIRTLGKLLLFDHQPVRAVNSGTRSPRRSPRDRLVPLGRVGEKAVGVDVDGACRRSGRGHLVLLSGADAWTRRLPATGMSGPIPG